MKHIYNKKLRNKCPICPKCQIRYILKPFSSYSEKVCWICHLKEHKHYKAAMKEIREPDDLMDKTKWRNGWFNWSTHMFRRLDCKSVKTGWSFAENLYLYLLFNTIPNLCTLNKYPKSPITCEKFTKEQIDNGGFWPKPKSKYQALIDSGESEWRAKTAIAFFNGKNEYKYSY